MFNIQFNIQYLLVLGVFKYHCHSKRQSPPLTLTVRNLRAHHTCRHSITIKASIRQMISSSKARFKKKLLRNNLLHLLELFKPVTPINAIVNKIKFMRKITGHKTLHNFILEKTYYVRVQALQLQSFLA